MFKRSYAIPIKPNQRCILIPIGDIHWDTEECDRDRLFELIEWIGQQEASGAVVRLVGLGDYLDFLSPSKRRLMDEFYETSRRTIEEKVWDNLREFSSFVAPLRGHFLGLVTGHHVHRFGVEKISKEWVGRLSDEWISRQLRCDYWGDGVALIRLLLPHSQYLDVLVYHGSGGAQTPGGRVQKRMKFAEIAPTAHIVITGHDNAKLAYPRSGLDYEKGSIKRYVIGSGSFQRAYLPGAEAGYAEKGGLVPADLGVVTVNIQVIERKGRWRVDYHTSV